MYIEIAKGKGKYQAVDIPETYEGNVERYWDEIELSEGQRARLMDDAGNKLASYRPISVTGGQSPAPAVQSSTDSEQNESDNEAESAPESIAVPIPEHENSALSEGNTVVKLKGNRNERWEQSIDVVAYEAYCVPAYFQNGGEYVRASGETNTGRESEINLVIVDKLRTGEFQAITARTGRYVTVPTANSYADLRQHLDGKKSIKGYQPREVYVSGDGGRQALTIDAKSEALVADNDLSLLINFRTSYDGSTEHELTLEAWNKTGEYRLPVPAVTRKLSARHTTNVGERIVDFAPQLAAMVDEWNESIVPMLAIFADNEMDSQLAGEELDRVAKAAGIGQRHRNRIAEEYTRPVSLYGVYDTIAQFAESEAKSREAADRWRESLAKVMDRDASRVGAK